MVAVAVWSAANVAAPAAGELCVARIIQTHIVYMAGFVQGVTCGPSWCCHVAVLATSISIHASRGTLRSACEGNRMNFENSAVPKWGPVLIPQPLAAVTVVHC